MCVCVCVCVCVWLWGWRCGGFGLPEAMCPQSAFWMCIVLTWVHFYARTKAYQQRTIESTCIICSLAMHASCFTLLFCYLQKIFSKILSALRGSLRWINSLAKDKQLAAISISLVASENLTNNLLHWFSKQAEAFQSNRTLKSQLNWLKLPPVTHVCKYARVASQCLTKMEGVCLCEREPDFLDNCSFQSTSHLVGVLWSVECELVSRWDVFIGSVLKCILHFIEKEPHCYST